MKPKQGTFCLNPCFSGGWSRSLHIRYNMPEYICGLNPCFSGGWSRRRVKTSFSKWLQEVLILVLVEDGLGGLARVANTFTEFVS